MNTVIKKLVQEDYRAGVSIPTLCKRYGFGESQIKRALFPNGVDPKITVAVSKHKKEVPTNEKDIEPASLLPAPPAKEEKTEKDPKWVAAGKLAWETRKKNLLAKKGMIESYQKSREAEQKYEELDKQIESTKNPTGPIVTAPATPAIIDPLVQHVLIVRKETIEMMQLAIEGLQAAIKLLQDERE